MGNGFLLRNLGIPQTSQITFYAASASGGSPTQLNTITITNQRVTAWTQATIGTPGQWDFSTADNSGHAYGMTFD